ncbi:MAG: hypothetical protein A3A96_02455 [Candidatus Zambryskibacteria bacterium RIFCSPLOWO2_01_FULL_39_39]|uniref:Uncharacterized protein n=1 Tax=Candidatus Zambryskibacteria bacterium RIFCSPLOWO2_01_FULL_39_39 TaxID=1802758 RepID=A0A1G2TZW6_9BACT|nr:MAG: hypothetical protein UT00_C0010G0022 [Parcubacteria group bacterium GW2011_GWA1_38_7]OHA87175.1 MAG: hypothetical protein A2644_02170 [Candidatus Zambryskibacteria bacterium RIFCSPHIGHO2_01_FULL_39_63]OHA94813.1 MAG: hypothetical protein A3B88_04215 [Candidatus Zambryskibacteria bacterium RIFCSPHIGHO2_02_FULL_39_19]OHA98303.1 MAG: hypothetical protein A3F20_01905 [Candidatus Zambryskibacteria bacterium RIFCSPHIGHO2_12_FULL_39_21]OHB02689.1 MAG: hypothetical protein A3A96_02455 [Candidat
MLNFGAFILATSGQIKISPTCPEFFIEGLDKSKDKISVASFLFLYLVFNNLISFLSIKQTESSYRFPKISFFIFSISDFFNLFYQAISQLVQRPWHFAHFDEIPYSSPFTQFFQSLFLFDVFRKLSHTVSSAPKARQNTRTLHSFSKFPY